MLKYNVLLNVLDKICEDAPKEYKSYKAKKKETEKFNRARSKAFIHLFLMVKCGITDFKERHDLITDGTQDGGIDAYFLDREKKKLFLIQSKFRTKRNFEQKSLTAEDLIKMEVRRILKGKEKDSNGNKYSKKIKEFQKKWSEVGDHAHYDYIIIILGNLTKYNDEQIRRLIDNSNYEIYNFERTYEELVFPLCSATYYDPKEIEITINLFDKEQPILKQKIDTEYGDFQVRLVFVPCEEIGRTMLKYKNSILKFNPRNYLSLSKNKVNRKIRDSILNVKKNDFAILNNGITILADSFKSTESTGTVDVGQVIMSNPQIINGGQTAYTLSEIYEKYRAKKNLIFSNKEVMLKVVISKEGIDPNPKFIEEISNATNQQTRVKEEDRRSNHEIQIKLQELIFNNFGYFYERKKGEFYHGITSKYIEKKYVINRNKFLRAYLAFKGNPADARRSGSNTLFKQKKFKEIFDNADNFKKMLFAYLVLDHLNKIKNDRGKNWGFGLRYGKMAIISAIGVNEIKEDITPENIKKLVQKKVKAIKIRWKKFEKWVVKKNKKKKWYFSEMGFDFDNYYKGFSLNSDIKEFFKD